MRTGRGSQVVRWVLRVVGAAMAVLVLLVVCLWANSLFLSFPEELSQEGSHGQHIVDRDGRLLARTTADGAVFRAPLQLDASGPYLQRAMIAAEDKRFALHPGVDFLAVARAVVQLVVRGRVVSGASTLTQQLARTTFVRPKTVAGKWKEMALALRIERELSKSEILELYLNRVHFGKNIVGAGAAADHYFGKPLTALDLAEAATLAGLVRAPSLYDPRLRPHLAQRERDRVLTRMVNAGFISGDDAERAKALPLRIHARGPLPGAHHWVRVVAGQRSKERLVTTLHGQLQRDVEALVRAHQRRLTERRGAATAGAAIVLDNKNGEILAYVGAPQFHDAGRGGQNDGVRALRQPGSTLKPFIYAKAMDELGMTPVTLLPDKPIAFRTSDSFYLPKNFDRKFRGSVLLRRALANSLNVPAVHVLSKLGAERVLETLRAAGLHSLTQEASHYGPALALGDGEVTLQELAGAYACLARGGSCLSPKLFPDAPIASKPVRVFSEPSAALISEILSNDGARKEAFGAVNAIDLPFPVAVKTGTSKGYRDTWTVGYTRQVTVAAWVGNFDGRPTNRLTGATAAGPLFRGIMEAAVQHLASTAPAAGARPLHNVALQRIAVCSETGTVPDGVCNTVLAWFAPGSGPQEALEGAAPELRVVFPKDGLVFLYDPAIPSVRQTLQLRASGSASPVTLMLNGAPLPTQESLAEWSLKPGKYQLAAWASDGAKSLTVEFFVNQRSAR